MTGTNHFDLPEWKVMWKQKQKRKWGLRAEWEKDQLAARKEGVQFYVKPYWLLKYFMF